jgi:hypothetical protein
VHLADWTVGGDARAAGTRVATAASTH